MPRESIDELVRRLLEKSKDWKDECLPREIKMWILDECKLRGIPEEEAMQALEWYFD